ncbi:MAG TPA: DUF4157 domain-containing protein [Candidatus Sulfopaludibacter sp.]|nr:DUF4157 domain-containing protein [Candidatus Sulfopaludibacter sp.]
MPLKSQRLPSPLPVSRRGDPVEQDARRIASRATASLRPGNVAITESGPLPAETRSQLERAFHWDFSRVRIHPAEDAAKTLHAKAFTLGSDIYLGPRGRNPDTLAHELSHVVQSDRGAAPPMLLREEELGDPSDYVEQVTGDDAKKWLDQVDDSIQKMEAQLKDTPDTKETADLKGALQRLKALRAAGKVTCWKTRKAHTYASYDSKSGEIRLHVNQLQQATPHNLMHESIHALHASAYEKLARRYGEAQAAGGTKDKAQGALFWKWKAWTEYWAYRRTAEYDNLSRSAENKLDPHKTAMESKDVKGAIAKASELDGKPFDPSTWEPPKEYKTPESKPAAAARK